MPGRQTENRGETALRRGPKGHSKQGSASRGRNRAVRAAPSSGSPANRATLSAARPMRRAALRCRSASTAGDKVSDPRRVQTGQAVPSGTAVTQHKRGDATERADRQNRKKTKRQDFKPSPAAERFAGLWQCYRSLEGANHVHECARRPRVHDSG